jgi:hypothetical protein
VIQLAKPRAYDAIKPLCGSTGQPLRACPPPEPKPVVFQRTRPVCVSKIRTTIQPDENLEYIVDAYGFLLPPTGDVYTAAEFAALIAQYYSLENPRNRWAVDYLLSMA